MDAGDEAAQHIIQLFERFGIPLAQSAKRGVLKIAKYGGATAIKSPSKIADVFRDTKTTQMVMESVEMAQMKKVAMVKKLRGVSAGSIDMFGSHLWFSKRIEKKLENDRNRKRVERYVQKLQKDPELFEREWEKYGHDKTSFNDKVITFNSPEEAVAAKYVYEKRLQPQRRKLGEISVLGANLFITKAINDRLKNPIANLRFNREINEIINNPQQIAKLMESQNAKEQQFMDELSVEADKYYNEVNPKKASGEKKETQTKQKDKMEKKEKVKDYAKPEHDPIKSNAEVAKGTKAKTQTQTKGGR